MHTIKKWKGFLLIPFLMFFMHPAVSQFKVVGYMPSWSGTASEIQYSKLTHINYSFIRPTTTGGLTAIDNTAKLQDIVSQGHAAGVKVGIAVGGWSDLNNADFQSMAANSSYRSNFINNLINLINQYNLDGIDIDWEYPVDGQDPANYSTMMSELGSALHARGKYLTAAVSAQGYYAGGILSSVFPSVDFLNLMVYDGGSGADHSPYSYAVSSLDYWINQRGLPASKAVLGVPFYARPSWKSFRTLVAEGANPNSDTYNGDYYNGITTIKAKTNLAFDRSCGGIMFWEISQDAIGANSLITAIDQVVDQRSGGTAPAAPSSLSATAASSSQINLSWSDNSSNESLFRIERSLNGSTWSSIATTGSNATSYSNTGLSASTTYYYRVRAENANGNSGYTNTANATTQSVGGALPSPWTTQDIGSPALAGTASHSSGTFTVEGAGADVWGASDQFRYVSQTLNGDGEIIARVSSIENTNAWAKAGVMIRASLAANAAHAMVAVTPSNGVAFQRRTSTGGTSSNTSVTGLSAPRWVRVVRSGSTFTGYQSADGTSWSTIGSVTITMTTSVYVGLFVTSHNTAALATATYTNVSVITGSTGTAPAAPSGLSATATSTSQINLSWTDNSNNETAFRIERSANGSSGWASITTVGANVTTYSNTGLTASTTYYYRVRAENVTGNSAYSNTANATTQGSSGGCTGVSQYVENGGYVAGSTVQNVGSKYECKPYPYSGWCNGAAWAYAPGTGTYWQDAWTLIGTCSSGARSANSSTNSTPSGNELSHTEIFNTDPDGLAFYPNPGVGDKEHTVTFNFESDPGPVRVYLRSLNGTEIFKKGFKEIKNKTLNVDMPSLSQGLYIVRVQGEKKYWVRKYLVK